MKLQLEHVFKRFDKKEVLQDINLAIDEGEFIALLGPSGCGKTTLLNALAGFLDIDGGQIAVGGEVWSSAQSTLAPERRNVGMVFQDFALWPHLTVFENVAFGLKVKRKGQDEIRRRVHEVLSIVQMTGYEKAFPHQLSGGQKQRIAIARALAPNPTVLLMDEPLSSLDAKLREQMRWDLLSIIRAARITTIYVTHDQVEALSMADRIVLLNSGRVEQVGTAQELYNAPKTEFAAYFMGASNLLQVNVESEDAKGTVVNWNGVKLYVRTTDSKLHRPVVLLRPSDIRLSKLEHAREHQNGTTASLVGNVVQRAYQGATWLYQVMPSQARGDSKLLEVWSQEEFDEGQVVSIDIPDNAGKLVEGGVTVQAVQDR
ncbi:ABC transporter ATP-binding protein [Alicyclobacillus tolerans]|uniref:ABC transporter ATP-binding protein n=1 Tax=Alicyclobacillus tolerans TaxID=90970 RepID=UPI001F31B23F|nr:ABC transporter ATP-binding protein [Alicyclobacillus tolerans]MCF8563902.1 ABC transporter ATP-binding protein [Alicyclobacillus tolerans]